MAHSYPYGQAQSREEGEKSEAWLTGAQGLDAKGSTGRRGATKWHQEVFTGVVTCTSLQKGEAEGGRSRVIT